mgnify:CR=1 FL=1
MPIFRGSKDATVASGDIVATQGDIAEALTSAQQAQAASEAAQAAAEAALDNFDDRYLGAKTSDPTVDNDGDSLIDGALYYNTVDVITRVYDVSEGTWSNLKPSATEQANINVLVPIASEVVDVSQSSDAVDIIASDLAGAGFDYDLGTITAVTEGVLGTPNGYIITLFNIRDDIVTVGDNDTNVTTVADNISNVNTVATDISDVTTVAGISTDVTTVSGISGDVTTVSGISTDVTTVAGIDTDVTTVSGISSDVTSVSGISSDVSTVSSINTDVTTVAANVTDVTNFSDVYIGPSATEPATRTDGSPLQAGDLYFDTSLDSLRFYDGTSWGTLSSRTDAEIRGLFSADGDITYNSSTGTFSFTERTDAQVRGLFSAADDLTYNSTTGEFSVTTYKDADVDAHLSGGTGVTYSTGTISIGQDVGTTADVTFNSVTADEIDCGSIA